MQEQISQALQVKVLYDQLNKTKGQPKWGAREFTEGLVGDVGDLMKLIMAREGLRNLKGDLDTEIKHELSDCLWAIVLIADALKIDLETEFEVSMKKLMARVTREIAV